MVTVHASPSGDGWSCTVTVDHGGAQTVHAVKVSRSDAERWGGGSRREDVESLVARSFDFLLEREPQSAILASFDLSAIQRYFPEYSSIFTNRPT